jgi:hypothetical protein
MTDTLNKRLQQQNLINFFKLFNPIMAYCSVYALGLLNYVLYAMIYKKWELLDDDSPYTRFHFQTFCENSGLPKSTVKYYLKKLSTGENPLIKRKSYCKSTYITFTDNVIDCLQIKTVNTHLKYAINNHYKKNKDVEYKAHPLFLQWKELFKIQKTEKKKMQKLIDTDINKKPEAWAVETVKEICEMAVEKDTSLNDKKVFNHLANNGELKMTAAVNKACRYLQSINNGTFLRNPNLFGSLKENILEDKRTKEAVIKLKSCVGDIKKIRAFILRCAYNYLNACEQGMDCAQSLKKSWPIKIDDFFMTEFFKSRDHIAYFLLFRFESETTEMAEALEIANNCGLSDFLFDKFDKFGVDNVEKYCADNSTGITEKKYWKNIKILVDEFHKLKNTNKTSYSMDSYFDFILTEVQGQVDYYGKVYPSVFDLTSSAIRQAMKIIKDK